MIQYEYEIRIKFQATEEVGDTLVDCIQNDYAATWSRLKLHGKVIADGEEVLKGTKTIVDIT